MSDTYSAAVFLGADSGFTISTESLAPVTDGEVLVAVTACSICASDLHTISGRRSCSCPAILGHEIVGRIVAIGGTVRDWHGDPLQIGDRLTWSIAASCGGCFFCIRGIPQKCEQLAKYGHAQIDQRAPLGGLATHCRLLKGTSLFRLPEGLSDHEAVPANCCTATSVAAIRTAGEIDDAVVLVLGAGALGLTVAEYAIYQNARQVIVADVDPSRLERVSLIQRCTPLLIDPADDPTRIPSLVTRLTEQRGVDLAVEVSGAPAAVSTALACCRTGGRIILVGSVFKTSPIELEPETIVRRMLRIEGLHNYRPEDLARALEFLDDLPSTSISRSLVGTSFSLTDIAAAVDCASSHQHLRVAVSPQE